ncbi:MAG: hypothetical protein P8X63_05730, partial [Desulfuromonadaceae bacterium]
SCHGVHFADSDASTVDGPTQTLSVGDGKLLKYDGPSRENPDQSLCQTCHNYDQHGADSGLGCMVCHSGHTYDAGGNPNYYLLRQQVALTQIPKTGAPGTVSLTYTSYPTPYDLGGICQECHTTLSPNHVAGATCTDCHSHTTGFTHVSGSGGYGCEDCHGADHVVSSSQAAWISFFDNGSDHAWAESGAVETYATCSLCHKTNLLAQHANDCALCHAGSAPPRNSFGAWNQTCQQGSCHPSYHAGVSDAHDNEYYSGGSGGCNVCHDHVQWSFTWDGVADNSFCGECHTMGADSTAPVSSSDLQASYEGAASISLWATDGRAIKAIYYRLDDGPIATYSSPISVSPPASGVANHSLEYWARDWANNVESPHHTGLFTVTGDTVAPVTSSDAQAAYGGTATIQLTATDNSTSLGVAATYYQDGLGGTVMEGTTVVIAAPASGSESHTLYFWSVDHAGNVETKNSVTFSVFKDETAPTTTTNLVPLPQIYGRPDLRDEAYLDFQLSAVDPDPGSGMAGIQVSSSITTLRFENSNEAWWDGGTWNMTVWNFLGDGNYPISYAARDNSGNIESEQTVTITVDRTRPVTASDAVAEYSGTATITLSPTDATSGVATTYYQDGLGGTVLEGTSAVIAAPASGSANHTLYFWSVDNVGNVEFKKNVSFTIYAAGTDIFPPTGSVSINGGADWTNSTSTTLSLTADDGGGSGLDQMRFSSDNSTWNAWEPYAVSRAWSLASGDGTKTVYVQFQDVAGNISESYSDTIGLETVAPATGCNAAEGGNYFSDNFSGIRTFTLTPVDTGDSGVAATWWQLDSTGGDWTSGTSVGVSAPESGTASHTLYWYSVDNAGNQETQQSVTFIMEAGGTENTAVVINEGAWVDANNGATGAWAYYEIYADDVLIGTKTANGTSTWNCPQTSISSGGHVDVGLYAGFSSYSSIFDSHTPITYTVTLPAGVTPVRIASGTIGNIVYVTAIPDSTAPVTTTDVVSGAVYVGNRTFSLSPADTGGTGVAGTWWQLDSTGGAWTSGTSVAVAAPASGTASHTLYWYSKDYAGNQETVKSVAFSLEAIGTETTSLALDQLVAAYADLGATVAWANYKIYADDVLIGSFNAPTAVPATATNQTFNWSCPQVDISAGGHVDIVMDAGFTNNTLWEPDSTVPFTYTLTLPAGTKRLAAATWTGFPKKSVGNDYDEEYDEEYTYVVLSNGTIGNIRYASTGSDLSAPVTTIDAVNGGSYGGDQNFTLTPTDTGGSGVESTWWSLDSASGPWTIGTAVPVSAPSSGTSSHTIYWYSRDQVGNQESQQAVSFNVSSGGG